MPLLQNLRDKTMKANRIRRDFGLRVALRHLTGSVGDALCRFEATTIVWLERADLSIPLDLPDDTEMRFLTANEVATFSQFPEYDLHESLVQKAFAGTDLCFAGLVDGQLASYGWYSLATEIPVRESGQLMHVPPNAAYMHNGFTHPDFRGRRLHGIGMGRALNELSNRGITALLSDVDWANQASLRSCHRLGYRELGNLYSFALGPARFAVKPRRAREFGVTFRRETAQQASKPGLKLALRSMS